MSQIVKQYSPLPSCHTNQGHLTTVLFNKTSLAYSVVSDKLSYLNNPNFLNQPAFSKIFSLNSNSNLGWSGDWQHPLSCHFVFAEEFVAHSSNVNCLALGPTSGRVMVTGGEDRKVNMWAIGKPNVIMVGFYEMCPPVGFHFSFVDVHIVSSFSSSCSTLMSKGHVGKVSISGSMHFNKLWIKYLFNNYCIFTMIFDLEMYTPHLSWS